MAVIVVDIGAGGDQEITGHHVGPLMEELVEGVLAVGAGLAEDDRAGRAHHRGAAHAHALAVRFHVELLQVGRQPVQPLVVGEHRVGREAEDVAVPDADQPENHRHVLLERGGAEMVVHGAPAGEEPREVARPDRDHQRQPDRRPDRVAAADPVPEAESALGAIPKAATLSSAVDIAAKCWPTAGSPSAATIQRRAVAALVIVSMVVKVFEATRNSVRDGSSGFSVSRISAPSTLETKCRARPVVKGRRAPASPCAGRGRSRRCRY